VNEQRYSIIRGRLEVKMYLTR